MKWITRSGVKVDRVACPWLIQDFVDPEADPALSLLGEIVRAADLHPSIPHPAGEGSRWIAHGFSALGLSDHEILAHEFAVYDALYAECQRQTS